MRKLIHDTLLNTQALTDIVGQRIHEQSSLGKGGIPAVPDKPFILIKFSLTTVYQDVQETSRANRKDVQIYMYQERGSYRLIDQMIPIVRDTLLGLPGTTSSTGARCSGVNWDGVSQDLDDETYDANMKFATFAVTSSQ